MNNYRAAIVGIGGFGSYHVKTMLGLAGEGLLDIVAFAELNIGAYRETYDALTASGAKHYTDYEEMLGAHPEADFVVIATPIAAHKPMCIRALRSGFHVIVEKPPAVTVQDIDEMIAAQRESGRLCQVNFQNTSGTAFRQLLDRLNAGAIGRITDVTGVGMWKRQRSYYERTRWAGKLVCDGQFVLDGTINNPFAHLMHNCLLAAGSGDAAASAPDWVQAELYHANEIEGDDVSCVRIGTARGVNVHFYAMLCHERNDAPSISIQGTEGEALWHYDNRLEIRSAGKPEYTFQGESEGAGWFGRIVVLAARSMPQLRRRVQRSPRVVLGDPPDRRAVPDRTRGRADDRPSRARLIRADPGRSRAAEAVLGISVSVGDLGMA
ncbi:MAG: oxidoreductase domain protein [Paenibacillus sp.]|nr:oxidoreductase domain protein [Paenibacillus sp.]